MQPFTKRLVDILPNQFHSKAVQVDGFLRVKGAPKGTVYAIGDASTANQPFDRGMGRTLMLQIHSDMLAHLLELWDQYDTDKDDNMWVYHLSVEECH